MIPLNLEYFIGKWVTSSFLYLRLWLLREKDHFGEIEFGKLILSVFAGPPMALPVARKELLHEKHSWQQRWL